MFTNQCYIRVYDKEKRKQLSRNLSKMGRVIFGQARSLLDYTAKDDDAIYCNKFGDYSFYLPKGENLKKYVDCGTDDELFMTLSALKDDSG